jgi:hypothetical protein
MTRIESQSQIGSQIEVSVIRELGDLLEAMEIRRAVFVHEFGCAEHEEFDGNDFSATQIIARVHGQVAGTMRIRYFADFIIPERLAVLPQFRKGRYGARGVAFALGTFGFNFARMKGYRQFVGYSVLGLERFWDHLAMASDGRVERYGDHNIECSGSICIGVFGALNAMPGSVEGRENHHLLTACEVDLPQLVAARAQELQALAVAQLSDVDRARQEQAAGLAALMGGMESNDRRADDRRATDRRAGDRRRTDRRAGEWWNAVSYPGDRRVANRRDQERRDTAQDRRAADRRNGDRRQEARSAQGHPQFEFVQMA